MNLVELAEGRQKEAGRIASNTVAWLSFEKINEHYKLVMRPHNPFHTDTKFMHIFRSLQEGMAGIELNSILVPEEYVDQNGEAWLLRSENVTSLSNALRKDPSMITNEEWKETFIDDLLKAVDYLHRKGFYALEITPQSILVTEKADHRLRLMPPCSPFIPMQSSLWLFKNDYLAPELFDVPNEDEPSRLGRQTDLYGIGHIIALLYHYGEIPYKYRKAVKKVSNPDPSKRLETVGEMQRMFASKQASQKVAKFLFTTAIVVGIGAAFFFWPEEPRTPQTYVEPVDESDELVKDSLARERRRDEVENYLRDSIWQDPDTALSLSQSTRMRQRELMKKAEIVFAEQFREQALPIIQKIYDKNAVNQVDANAYLKQVEANSAELQKLVNRLAKQYQVDVTTANRICSPIVEELSSMCKSAENLKRR